MSKKILTILAAVIIIGVSASIYTHYFTAKKQPEVTLIQDLNGQDLVSEFPKDLIIGSRGDSITSRSYNIVDVQGHPTKLFTAVYETSTSKEALIDAYTKYANEHGYFISSTSTNSQQAGIVFRVANQVDADSYLINIKTINASTSEVLVNFNRKN